MSTGRVTAIATLGEIVAAAEGDTLARWTAQALKPGVRAWRLGEALAVACPDLSERDRLAVHAAPTPGGAHDAVVLVRHALADVGAGYRIVADTPTAQALVAAMPELAIVHAFGWMETTTEPPEGDPAPPAEWLAAADEPAITRLLEAAFPTSHAMPGRSGIRRWAGVRDPLLRGELAASTADAWTTPSIGFVAGVASRVDRRRTGAGRAAVVFVTRELVRAEGRAALMVDAENEAAIGLYRKLGFGWREVTGVRVCSPRERAT